MNNFNPLISVIMPVYNGENYLKKAIESVLIQTYNNIEIVLVDDGSTDGTEEIALSFGEKIRYFKKENGGVATALNFAIEKSNGEYISWLSHDDTYEPNKIKSQIKELSKLENKKTIIYTNIREINNNGELLKIVEFEKQHDKALLNYSVYPILKECISGCTLLIHKEVYEEFGAFKTDLLTTQDYELWFRMAQKYPLKHIPQILVNSRIHPEQDSRSIRAFFLKECDELWTNFTKQTSENQLKKMFKTKSSYLAPLAKKHYKLFMQKSATESIFKIVSFENNKKNILTTNIRPNSKMDFASSTETFSLNNKYNIFILDIQKDIFSLYFENTEILKIKLTNPISFEHNNMFLYNEVSMLIEKLLTILEIDLVHFNGLIDVGIGTIQTINSFSIPIIYSAVDFKELWINQKNPAIKKQIKLFANKYSLANVDKIIIEQEQVQNLENLIIDINNINFSIISSKKEFDNFEYMDKFYAELISNKAKKTSTEEIRKTLIIDLLELQQKTTT